MLTVESLTSELGLKVLAGGDGAAEREIRWVHITELLDPTPWLSGGELLLTTGIPLENAEKQRAFIRRLADAGVAGLGFGTGFDHAKVPKAVLTEAKAAGFPVFEVPYETPFIAITEAAFSRLVNEQYDVLSRGIAVNERLERLVLQGGGLDEVAREIAAAIGGSSVVLDARGEVLANGGRRLPEYLLDAVRAEVQPRGTAAAPFVPSQPDLRGRALAHPVSPRPGSAEAWLVVVRRSGELGDFERLCVQQAAIVVALELMRERVARETERRLSGEVLAATLSGRLAPDDIRDRLAPFGIGERAVVLAFQLDDAAAAEPALAEYLAGQGRAALVAPHPAGRRELLCAVVDGSQGRSPRAGERGPRGSGGCTRPDPRGDQPLAAHRARPPLLPRGSLRPRGDRLRQRRRPRGGLAPRPRCVHAPALGPGRRGASPLLRERPRADRGLRRALRRRAAALPRGLHRPQRPLGAGGERLLLPPAHTPLPDQAHRGAHRTGPEPRERPGRALAGSASEGADRVRVAVLGAGGTIAPAIVRDLAESEEVTAMRLLDIDLRRAEAVATEHGGGKAQARQADATTDLAEQLAGMEVLVNSAAYRINLAAMRACLDAGCHYMDLGGLYHVTAEQLELSAEFEQRGRLALLGIGSAPGQDQPARGAGGARAARQARSRSRSSPRAATSTRPRG